MTAPFESRVAPHSLDAERAVLGTFYLSEYAEKILPLLAPEHFYDPRHQTIYRAIQALNQTPLDPLMIQAQLDKTGDTDRCGGLGYLCSLEQYVIDPRNVRHHAQTIIRHWAARQTIRMSTELSDSAYVGDEMAEKIPAAMTRMQRILESQTEHRCAEPEQIASDTWEVLSAEQGNRGVMSGLERLDRCLNGFQRGDLIVLGARPSVGKTALAIQLAYRAAINGHSVMLCEMEMPKEQIMARMAAIHCGVNLKALREHTAGEKSLRRVYDFLQKVASSWKLFVFDECGLDPVDVETQASLVEQKHGLDLLIVDYLQLMHIRNRDKNMNRNLEIGEIAWRHKKLARDLKIPVLLLAQLSRDVEKRGIKATAQRPKLSDLRDSGEIEQHTDIVMFLHRLTKSDGDTPGNVDLLVEKHRQGPLAEIPLCFRGTTTEFYPRQERGPVKAARPYRED